MPIRPPNLVDRTRPDNTQYVSQVERSNGINSFITGENEELRYFAAFFHPDSAEFPWANAPLSPGEEVFLSRSSTPSVEDGTVGQPVSYSNPLTIPDGVDFELVQDYIDMRGDVEVVLWGSQPSASPPFNSKDQYEPIAPVFYDGASGPFNVQRVAEPTSRSLLNPQLQGEQAVAATVRNTSQNPEPIRGKVYIAAVVKTDPEA